MSETFNFVVDDDVIKKIEKVALKEQRSISGQIRWIIDQWFKQQEEK